MIENLNYTNNEQFGALLQVLKDSSALVRHHALLKFRDLSVQDKAAIALKHVNDTTKLVRIAVAQLMIGVDRNNLSVSDANSLQKATSEFETMLYSNADFSTGRMQLGDYFLQNNDIKNAIKHYNIALQKDSLLIPVYSNLATAYSIDGQHDESMITLQNWINIEPELSRPYYLRALLHFELKENDKAVADLKKAIELNSEDSRSMYNLATFYFQNKDFNKSEIIIKKALKVEPNNQDFKYLLALVYRDQGKFKSSQRIMQELRANQQGRN